MGAHVRKSMQGFILWISRVLGALSGDIIKRFIPFLTTDKHNYSNAKLFFFL